MTAAPLFSVVMPVYNGAPLLAEALDSLRAQEPFEGGFEVLAADDGSTDGSRELLEAAARDLPLRVLDGARRGNWVASTNKAIREAAGEFVVFLHQDDRFRPARLRRLAEEIRANPSVGFFVNDTAFVAVDGKPLGPWRPTFHPGFCPPADALPPLMVQDTVAVPGVAFRRASPAVGDGLDEAFRYTADWEFWLRLAARGGLFRIAETLSEFRVHRGSQTVAIAGRQDEMRRNLEDVLERYLPALEEVLPPRLRPRYRRLARLGVETDLFLGAGGARAPLPWRPFLRALLRCTPADWVRYVRLSAVVPRTAARVRAGFLRRPAKP